MNVINSLFTFTMYLCTHTNFEHHPLDSYAVSLFNKEFNFLLMLWLLHLCLGEMENYENFALEMKRAGACARKQLWHKNKVAK